MEMDSSSGVSASKDADLGTMVTVKDQATALNGTFPPMTLFCFILAHLQSFACMLEFTTLLILPRLGYGANFCVHLILLWPAP